jgi:rifampicin phosphotransferase
MTSTLSDALLPIGSGRATALGISPKAAILDVAAKKGLRVPHGFVLLSGAALPAHVPLEGLVAVRSAFGAEDGGTQSLAGWFSSKLNVAVADIAGAVDEVRASALRREGTFRTDVLLLNMVAAKHAGVAFTEEDYLDDIVNVTVGLADKLVSGEVAGERVVLRRFANVTEHGSWATRLQSLLADVRKSFGRGENNVGWDVEWADDGTHCWLVQIRPITRPLVRTEMLSVANHKEILPALPSTFMVSVIESCSDDLFHWWTTKAADLPKSRPFVIVRGGRPFINQSLLEDTMTIIGLPTHMVADGFGGDSVHHGSASPARLARHVGALIKLGVAQIRALAFHRRRCTTAEGIGAAPVPSWDTAVADAQRAYTGLVTGMMPLSSASAAGTTLLRKLGTLTAHAQRHQTITSEMARALTTSTPEDFLRRFGHRGVYESDLARPRYAEVPPTHVRIASTAGDQTAPRRNLRTILTTPLWILARIPIRAREEFRDSAMKGFANVRTNVLRLADDAVNAGQLPHRDDIWLLTVNEVCSLSTGFVVTATDVTERLAERVRLSTLEPSDLVSSIDHPEHWQLTDAPLAGALRGLSLTGGLVEGVAVVLSEPVDDLGALLTTKNTGPLVLVARSVDAGWMAVFHQADAVVVETGGDLSHGSILLRELGVPAITNVRGIRQVIQTGDRVRVDATRATITKL